MAYVKHTWACGEDITDELLNNLEEGIEANQPMVLTYGGTTQEEADAALVSGGALNATWQEISDALKSGRRVVVTLNPYLEETIAGSTVGEVVMATGGGLLDDKYSVAVPMNWKDATTMNVWRLRCDNATDYPRGSGTPIG